jgi:hypothetical protein
MDRVQEYLRIFPDYCPALAGLRWADGGHVLERADATTFAFVGEVVGFLEGFATARPLIHFNHILHLLHLLRTGQTAGPASPQAERLHQAFRAAERVHRNAGAFCAVLCLHVPAEPETPDAPAIWQQAVLQTCSVTDVGLGQEGYALAPPLPAVEFERGVFTVAKKFTDEELAHWFRHGRGPVDDAPRPLVEAIQAVRPRSLPALCDELVQRARLAGAAPFVDQLVSALSLPPRRLGREVLPLGGYADVTTRGPPETLLPSQLVHDGFEFARRFAQGELLYFRREEPPDPVEEELVVVLDQGVRTWGVVRLALTAAVFALARFAGRRRLPCRVASTGTRGQLCDPLRDGAAAFAEMLEASDLSPHPGPALAAVLDDEATVHRDIVLLTHPRSLAEPNVAAAARQLAPDARLFAVTVDGHGAAALQEVRQGAPVPLSRFRIDLSRGAPPPKPAPPDASAPWRGDVEPVPFPFRFGVAGRHGAFHFAFDVSGDWLLTASRYGLIHATRTDGSGYEMLPRGMYRRAVLTDPLGVLGVAGGFVVIGILGGSLVGFHYEFGSRRCTVRVLAEEAGDRPTERFAWWYLRRLQALVVSDRGLLNSIHLPTGNRAPCRAAGVPPPTPITRSRQPGSMVLDVSASPPPHEDESQWMLSALPLQPDGPPEHPEADWHWPLVRFVQTTGEVKLRHVSPTWDPFIPESDGKRMLKGAILHAASCQRESLALIASGLPRTEGKPTICLFRGPEGVPAGEYPIAENQLAMALSADGRLLARPVARNEIEVRDIQTGGAARCVTTVGRYPQRVSVYFGDRCLLLCRTAQHLFRWDTGRLIVKRGEGDCPEFTNPLDGSRLRSTFSRAIPSHLQMWVGYDRHRFVAAAYAERQMQVAVLDAYGQVCLCRNNGDFLAMFFAFRDQAAVWMADGTCWGAPALLGRSPTPGGDEKIGHALLDAWK